MEVTVTPDDYGFDPVAGTLVASSVDEVAIRRSDPAVGEVVVHFPRFGFRVARLLTRVAALKHQASHCSGCHGVNPATKKSWSNVKTRRQRRAVITPKLTASV